MFLGPLASKLSSPLLRQTALFTFLILAVCTRAQPPIITDVQPYKAATGAPVTILGSGFSPSRTGNKVLFNASPAQVLSASSTQLTVLVPPAATYGLISVHTQGLSAQTRVPFSPINTGDSLVPLALNDIIEVQNSPLSNMPHNSAHSADLDGDGLSDIVAIKVNTPRELVWYRTRILNGQPDFAETGKINDLPGANFLLKIADINGDGKVDVVAANSAQDSIYFFLNQSTPSNIQFIKALALPTGQYPVDLTITDLNGDGLLDVAVVHLNSNPIRLYIRSTPAAMAYQVIDLPNSFDCSSVLAADFNGDGRTDIITLNAFAQATLHTNTTTPGSPPSFTQTTFTGIGTQVVECMLTDANEDGWPDILLLGNNHARVMLNNKSIPVSFTFRDPTAFNQFSFITYPAILADLNGNGRPEIVAGFNNKTQVYIGPDILQTPPPWAYSPVYANAGSVISSQTVGDVTGDGKLDILGFNQTGNLVISSIRPQLFHLSDFNPKSGGHAMPVSITGQNLSGTTQVSFGGVAADSFHFISPQLIIAYPSSVPSSGQIEVTAYGYTKRLFNFNWVPKPKMVRVFRSDPYAANTVHIYGENFTMQDSLYLAGKYLGYTFNGGNHIVTLTETVSGTLLLKGPGGADSVPNFSFVPSPIITTVSGGEVPGDTLTITGNHLLTTSKLTVGEVIVPGFIALDDHTLKAKLPPFPLGGVIGINTSGGTLTYPGFYNGWDSITYTPLSAKAGDTLTLTIHKPIPGWPMPADTRVLFQQSAGKIISINGNQIKVQVPFGYTNPTVSVTAFGITKHAPRPLTITFGNGPSLLHPYYFEHAKTLVPHRAIMQGFWLSNDADGDGLVDFLQIIADSQATLLVYQNISTMGRPSVRSSSTSIPINPGTTYKPLLADLNADGKTDLLIVGEDKQTYAFVNTSTPGNISYQWHGLVAPFETQVAIDLEGDGRTDLLGFTGWWADTLKVQYGKASSGVAFGQTKNIPYFTSNARIFRITTAFINNDNKPDLLVQIRQPFQYQSIYMLNTSVPGDFFRRQLPLRTEHCDHFDIHATDLDRDGLPDLIYNDCSSNSLFQTEHTVVHLHTNTSQPYYALDSLKFPFKITPGETIMDVTGDGYPDIIAGAFDSGAVRIFVNNFKGPGSKFLPPVFYPLELPSLSAGTPHHFVVDVDNDGRPDILTGWSASRQLSISRNTGTQLQPQTVCPEPPYLLTASPGKQSYQWQRQTGPGIFENITDGTLAQGTQTATLSLLQPSTVGVGQVYRCLMDGQPGPSLTPIPTAVFTGQVSNNWSNPQNWNCGQLPNSNSHVIIERNVIVDTPATVNTLWVAPGATVHVNPGITLEVKNP